MSYSGTLKLVVKRHTYDILSADTGFYAFMDDSRLYYTFIKLIYEEDLRMFTQRAEAMEEGSFLLRMVAVDGSAVPYYTTMRAGATLEQIQLTLVDVAQLVADEKSTMRHLAVQSKLLELYGDDLFIYDQKEKQVKLISKYNIAPEEKVLTLAELEELLKQHISEDKMDDVAEFIMAVETGKRYFEICVDGNIMDSQQEAKYTVIRGASVYEDGEVVASVGYVQKEEEPVTGSVRKTDLDLLTGLLSKSEITNMAIRAVDVEKRQNVSIAIVDIDYFKKVNDTYGHMVGDETLKKVAAIMEAEVGNSGVVGRIGGDEFFILYYDAYDLETSRERLRSIKNTVTTTFPVGDENGPAITLSIGCAAYPKDADNYMDLFALADFALYRAKEKGRNRYIIYDQEKHGTLAEIHKTTKLATRINSRGDMSKGDILCVIMDRVFNNEVYPLDKLLDDYIENFEPQRITIYDAETAQVLHMVGAKVLSMDVIEETQGYVHGDYWQRKYVYDDAIINDISIIENKDPKVYEQMKKQGIISCIHIKFEDRNGVDCILSLEAVNKKINWNHNHMHFYRLMAQILSQYAVK